MITIASFDNVEQAELLKIRLEQAGIQAFIADKMTVGVNWMYSNVVGGVKVQISEDDLEKAKSCIEECGDLAEEREPLSEYKCPNCGSSKVEYRRISKTFFMVSLLLLSIPLALYHPRLKCLDCGRTWKKDKNATNCRSWPDST